MLKIAFMSFAIWISLSFLVVLIVARVGMHMQMARPVVKPLRARRPPGTLLDRF
jgi:hypothetical protein